MTTHVLDAGKIVLTVARLRDRIAERFPGSGLAVVAADLTETARATAARVDELNRSNLPLRALALVAVIAGLAAQIYVARLVDWSAVLARADVVGITQGLDSIVNLLLLAFAALWFVLTLEQRLKRRRILHQLFELRSFAHVVDMHQLTKDPTILLAGGSATPSSPERRMTEFELSRYLDYCAELLALIAKLAALYAASNPDPAIVTAVTGVEELTSDLGRKIWQKIMIINRLDERQG
ncbi:MAG: hypothetical protein JSR60_15035 [Proteobacteria bacterium]|nr:hypothetical protein [Pseudomonadota bacterium]